MTSIQAKLHHLDLSLQELLSLFSGISQNQFGMSLDHQMTLIIIISLMLILGLSSIL